MVLLMVRLWCVVCLCSIVVWFLLFSGCNIMCMYCCRCECRFGSIRFSWLGVCWVVYSSVMLVLCVWLWKLNNVILLLWCLVMVFRLLSVIRLWFFSDFSVVCVCLIIVFSGRYVGC